jgi:hypothetical protein
MKTAADKRLFWYLKEGTEIDLANLSQRDMYVQQVLSHGKTGDIKKMIRILTPDAFKESFRRVKRFLAKEIRMFWENGLGDTGEHPEKNT